MHCCCYGALLALLLISQSTAGIDARTKARAQLFTSPDNLLDRDGAHIGDLQAIEDEDIFEGSVLSHQTVQPAMYRSVLSGLPWAQSSLALPESSSKLRISVGESWNAPHAQLWLEADPHVTVLGFEPNPTTCEMLSNMQSRVNFFADKVVKGYFINGNFPSVQQGGPQQLDVKHVGVRYFLGCVAMSNTRGFKSLYSTVPDPGTSSLHTPVRFSVSATHSVPVLQLQDVLQFVDWDKYQYIEQLKTDCQGHDLQVLVGAGRWLTERVVWVTPEIFCDGYKTEYSEDGKAGIEAGADTLVRFLEDKGFVRVATKSTPELRGVHDAFLNSRFSHLRHKVVPITE